MTELTACIVAQNEEQNLPRALASLLGVADEIVVVDGLSRDRTADVAREAGARVILRAFTDHSDQKNFAAAQAGHDWILLLDADEELSAELRSSIAAWKREPPRDEVYEFSRRSQYLGRWIRYSGWYPDRVRRLYRRDRAQFADRIHSALVYAGPVGRLPGDILHYPYRSAAHHRAKVETYTTVLAQQLFDQGQRRWIFPILVGPPWAFVQSFLLRAGFLDGAAGWRIACMAARYVFLKYGKLGALVRNSSRAQRRGAS